MLLGASGAVAHAQVPQQPPAYIAAVEGSATLEREGDVQPAVENMPIVAGDRLRTTAGRVEIRFPDGTGIEVDEDSEIEMLTATRVRLLAGTLDHLEAEPVSAPSAAYLPQDLQMYSRTFDQNGTWQDTAGYGYVWYPRVAADWRPYYDGYWDPVPSYGWTWIGANRWSWPTHHYGRWGYSRNAWFWIPDRSFSAAWVSWGAADGYVSWCPLGYDNRSVFALSAGYGNDRNGWTVLPRTHFGVRGVRVNRHAVAPQQLSPRTAFVTQNNAPVAVPRGGARRANTVTAPAAAGTAVPRTGDRPGRLDRAGDAARSQVSPPVNNDRPDSTNQRGYRRSSPYGQPAAPGGPPPILNDAQPRTGAETPAAIDRHPPAEYRGYRRASPGDPAPSAIERRPPNDHRPATNEVPEYRRRTSPFIPPAPPQPQPQDGTPPAQTAPPAPSYTPHVMPRYRQMPDATSAVPPSAGAGAPSYRAPQAMPRYTPQAAPAAPAAPPRATAPPPPPPPPPPPARATPQRSAPPDAAPAGTATPRSGDAHGSRRRG